MLSAEESGTTGAYRFDKTPYWRFVCDTAGRPGVEEVVCIKGSQVGWSELCRNLLGYWIDAEPGPILILLPDQKAARNFKRERIDPLVKHTAAVGRHLTAKARDNTDFQVQFDTCLLNLTWSASRSGVRSRPIRRLISEEPDDFKKFSGDGGDPLAKAEQRLSTFLVDGRSSMLTGGTPTNRLGVVFTRWEMCSVRYHYWVPCPHCGGFQRLVWPRVNFRHPALAGLGRAAKAARVKADRLAHYDCAFCPEPVRDYHKPQMLLRGLWAAEQQTVGRDGRVVGTLPRANRVGFALPGLYSPWVTFSQLAAEWIEAQQGNNQKLAVFLNERLAETFEEERSKVEPSAIARKAVGGPRPGVVPGWTRWLIASADTQGTDDKNGYFWWTVRAWGLGYRSQLVDFGVAHSKAELVAMTVDRPYPVDGGPTVTPSTLYVDSGGPRWLEVYELAQGDNRIVPTKGASQPRELMVSEKLQKDHKVVLWLIDPGQAKDQLSRLIGDPDATRWTPHAGIVDQEAAKRDLGAAAAASDYCRQMASEAKIFDPKQGRDVWVEVVKDSNHLWDCEVIQAAAAWRLGAGAPEPEPEPEPAATPDAEAAGGGGGGNFATAHLGRY